MGLKSGGLEKSLRNVSEIDVIPSSGDLHARYDATEISASDGNTISSFTDETGNGYDLTAGNAATYKTSIINGNAVLRFDGSGDQLDTTWTPFSQPNHIFFVGSLNETVSSGWAFVYDSPDGNNRHAFAEPSEQVFSIWSGTDFRDGTSDQNNHIFSLRYDSDGSSNSEIRIDGTTQVTGNSGSHQMGGFRLGADRNGGSEMAFDVGEILIYPMDKSAEVSNIESYLSNKWGINI